MNKELGSLLAMAAGMQASILPHTLRRIQKLKLKGKNSKSQDEQTKAILVAQAKREKRAAKRLGKQI